MSEKDFETILKMLCEQFPNQLLLGVQETASVFGVSPKTLYNMTSRKSLKKFPVQPIAGPGKKFKITDIAHALAKM